MKNNEVSSFLRSTPVLCYHFSTILVWKYSTLLYALLHVMQACQYIKSQKSDTLLGKVNVNTTWELNNHEADKFQFVITYKNGQEGRYDVVEPHLTESLLVILGCWAPLCAVLFYGAVCVLLSTLLGGCKVSACVAS